MSEMPENWHEMIQPWKTRQLWPEISSQILTTSISEVHSRNTSQSAISTAKALAMLNLARLCRPYVRPYHSFTPNTCTTTAECIYVDLYPPGASVLPVRFCMEKQIILFQ